MIKNNADLKQETAEKLIALLSHAPADTAVKSLEFAKKPVVHIQKSQIIAGILGTTGLVKFAFGVENLISTIPSLQSPFVEIGLGLALLTVSGLFLKKLI